MNLLLNWSETYGGKGGEKEEIEEAAREAKEI